MSASPRIKPETPSALGRFGLLCVVIIAINVIMIAFREHERGHGHWALWLGAGLSGIFLLFGVCVGTAAAAAAGRRRAIAFWQAIVEIWNEPPRRGDLVICSADVLGLFVMFFWCVYLSNTPAGLWWCLTHPQGWIVFWAIPLPCWLFFRLVDLLFNGPERRSAERERTAGFTSRRTL